jgi:hypothetical protein
MKDNDQIQQLDSCCAHNSAHCRYSIATYACNSFFKQCFFVSKKSGGGCGIGLGLGWGFGNAIGCQYRSSKVQFQGIEFSKKVENDQTGNIGSIKQEKAPIIG